MGLTFRKSFKIGKNTRLNLSSKGGVGISTGVKGARISTNKKGTRVYGGTGPVRFQKKISTVHTEPKENFNQDLKIKETEEKKTGFFKKHYKEIIIIIIGIIVGNAISGSSDIKQSDMTAVSQIIEEHTALLEEKRLELEELENQKIDLQESIANIEQ